MMLLILRNVLNEGGECSCFGTDQVIGGVAVWHNVMKSLLAEEEGAGRKAQVGPVPTPYSSETATVSGPLPKERGDF
jgi:hypothetical protein